MLLTASPDTSTHHTRHVPNAPLTSTIASSACSSMSQTPVPATCRPNHALGQTLVTTESRGATPFAFETHPKRILSHSPNTVPARVSRAAPSHPIHSRAKTNADALICSFSPAATIRHLFHSRIRTLECSPVLMPTSFSYSSCDQSRGSLDT